MCSRLPYLPTHSHHSSGRWSVFLSVIWGQSATQMRAQNAQQGTFHFLCYFMCLHRSHIQPPSLRPLQSHLFPEASSIVLLLLQSVHKTVPLLLNTSKPPPQSPTTLLPPLRPQTHLNTNPALPSTPPANHHSNSPPAPATPPKRNPGKANTFAHSHHLSQYRIAYRNPHICGMGTAR